MDEVVQTLQDVVKLNTVNGAEKLVADYLIKLFEQHGISCKQLAYQPDRVSLVAEIGDGNGPVVGFDGHEDVVALGDASKWHVDALSGAIDDDNMYGRGTSDMKSGLLAGAWAMIHLKEAGVPLHGTFRFMATVGEEYGQYGARQLADAGYAQDLSALIVGEPSGADKRLLQKPELQHMLAIDGTAADRLAAANHTREQHFIELAHKGSLTFTIHSKGVAAHSSMPEIGQNAIDALMTFYQREKAYFESIKSYQNPVLGPVTPVVTMVKGGEQVNTVPASADLSVKIRTIPELPNAKITAAIKAIIADLNAQGSNLSFEMISDFQPMHTAADTPLIQAANDIGQAVLEQALPQIGVPGGTDASSFLAANPDIDVVVFGPGNITAHQVNEYVDLEMYRRFIKIYERMVTRLLS
ncbi:succinyl-diaminopimelate desuccinylase [Levilactobacillus zymae]|uniref:Succinyl-diaminopimelate desuccinylase n=1 Tax=Levilactobacillus zymae TaxID=267363 RepID=A0ABQ0WYC8_9LACO|nr:ArgE/DapE family deacylase [Levilactobacillus zymae]KRL12492.1 succinyl-diaminopimelate desuccinylase [Levilactobacillus zymae DSM 19395]QFR61678.1 M20/M25/M40 family metallo-hydrolase [Levilactobacillus zymae]GEO72910.1 succinyl-diaminopimelate desuccinylase [Levilactobacillus zymae]